MSRSRKTGPTDGELAILRVLWEEGPSTVRQVHEELKGKDAAGYTTTLKLLQIMAEKGLVERDESQRSHVYSARHSEEITQRKLVKEMLDKAFSGSAHKLVMHALSAKNVSAGELAKIRELLDELEGGS